MNPTNSIYDDPNLKSARSAYESASAAATSSEAAGYSLPDQLKSALTAKFSQNNPLIQAREGALKNYLNETTAGPLSVTPTSAGGTAPVVLNPLQQADLIQRRKSNVLAPLATANDLLAMQTGGMADIINATSRAQQGETAKLQGKAKLAGESYTNILNELSAKVQEAQQARDNSFREKQYQEDIRRYEEGKARAAQGGNIPQIDWFYEKDQFLNSPQLEIQGLAPGEEGSILPEGWNILDYNKLLNKLGGY